MLGECIRLFVQPLLLRQLEGRQMYRRRQNKRRSSLRSVPVLGAASARSARGHRRAGSSGNIGITKGGGSSSSLHSMMVSASYSVAAAASSAPTLSTTATPTTKMLVMDADLSIFSAVWTRSTRSTSNSWTICLDTSRKPAPHQLQHRTQKMASRACNEMKNLLGFLA